MKKVESIEQSHPVEPHSSSFLPIQKVIRPGLEASYHSNLDNIEERGAGQDEEDDPPILPGHQRDVDDAPSTTEATFIVTPGQQSVTQLSTRSGAISPRTSDAASTPISHGTTDPTERAGGDGAGARFLRRTLSLGGMTGRTESVQVDTEDVQQNQVAHGYLPCHYFDYIAGTSTGGSVLLGFPAEFGSWLT